MSDGDATKARYAFSDFATDSSEDDEPALADLCERRTAFHAAMREYFVSFDRNMDRVSVMSAPVYDRSDAICFRARGAHSRVGLVRRRSAPGVAEDEANLHALLGDVAALGLPAPATTRWRAVVDPWRDPGVLGQSYLEIHLGWPGVSLRLSADATSIATPSRGRFAFFRVGADAARREELSRELAALRDDGAFLAGADDDDPETHP